MPYNRRRPGLRPLMLTCLCHTYTGTLYIGVPDAVAPDTMRTAASQQKPNGRPLRADLHPGSLHGGDTARRRL